MESRPKMTVAVLLVLAVLVASLPACIVAPAPPPGAEIRGPAPHPNAAWTPGHWGWKGLRRVWVPGHYK